ncbi:transmembrane and coiled-coil domain-containing protein 5B-like [Rhea pennata]|uniref:transmembrane and coiled-coil domain-containing protein 5B-like n=1 Tax=Rhea pennata TaxID=8795 RepID=UPI002E255BA2
MSQPGTRELAQCRPLRPPWPPSLASRMVHAPANKLSWTNENLKNQIWNLRERVAELGTENQKLVKENEDIKDWNRRLQASTDCFRTLVGDLHGEVDNARDTLKDRENKIKQIELQNKKLDKINEQLKVEIMEMSCQISAYQDDKMYQEKDTSGERTKMYENERYLEHLQIKLEVKEKMYEQEKLRACQLRDTLEEFDKLREVQRNYIVQMKGQLEELGEETALLRAVHENSSLASSLLHEFAKAKLLEDSLPSFTKEKFFCYTWSILKLLLLVVVCIGLFNNYFTTDSVPLLFNDSELDIVIQALYPYLSLKNEGLLPF